MPQFPGGHLYSKVDIMLEYKTQKKDGFLTRGTYRAGGV